MAQGCNFSSSFFIFSINSCSAHFSNPSHRKRRVFVEHHWMWQEMWSRLCEWNFMAHLLKSWLKNINLSFCRSLEWFTNTRKCQIMDDSKSCVRYLFTPPENSVSFSIFTDSSRSVYRECRHSLTSTAMTKVVVAVVHRKDNAEEICECLDSIYLALNSCATCLGIALSFNVTNH